MDDRTLYVTKEKQVRVTHRKNRFQALIRGNPDLLAPNMVEPQGQFVEYNDVTRLGQWEWKGQNSDRVIASLEKMFGRWFGEGKVPYWPSELKDVLGIRRSGEVGLMIDSEASHQMDEYLVRDYEKLFFELAQGNERRFRRLMRNTGLSRGEWGVKSRSKLFFWLTGRVSDKAGDTSVRKQVEEAIVSYRNRYPKVKKEYMAALLIGSQETNDRVFLVPDHPFHRLKETYKKQRIKLLVASATLLLHDHSGHAFAQQADPKPKVPLHLASRLQPDLTKLAGNIPKDKPLHRALGILMTRYRREFVEKKGLANTLRWLSHGIRRLFGAQVL